MWKLGALAGGALGALTVWFVANAGSQGLPDGWRQLVVLAVVAPSALAGFLGGAAIARRAGYNRQRMTLYSALTGAICGGTIGLVCAVVLTAAYLFTYASWPHDTMDDVLMVLAYPAFGALGWFLGAAAGLVCGGLIGSAIRLAAPAQREEGLS